MPKPPTPPASLTGVHKPPAKVRISPKVRQAVEAMIWDGLTRSAAAERAGMTDKNLYKALRMPKVKALMAQELAQLREGAAARAYVNIVQLGEGANSEDVKLRANSWVAGVDGVAPVKKVAGTVQVSHSFEGFAYPGVTIDTDTTSADDGG